MGIVSFTRFLTKATVSKLTVQSRLLAQHPDVLAKLRKEIGSIVGLGMASRLPDRNDLKKMKYLSLVLKEGIISSLTFPRPDFEQDPLITVISASTLPLRAHQLTHRTAGDYNPNGRRT